MVDEGALEHLVHLAQVVLVGHPVPRAADQPEHHAALLPAARAGRPASASSGSTGRLICHQVRTRSKPAPRQPACWRSSSAKAPVSICWTSSPRARADLAGLRHGPLEQHVGAAVGDVVGQVALDDVHEQHPALGPVVDAAPGPDLAVGVAEHDVLPRPQPVLGDLDQDVVDRAPAQPRPCRSWARSSWVSRATSNRSDGSGVPTSQPGGRWRVVREDLVGVALEPAVLGDHGPRFCRTPDRALTRPRFRDVQATPQRR